MSEQSVFLWFLYLIVGIGATLTIIMVWVLLLPDEQFNRARNASWADLWRTIKRLLGLDNR